MFIVSLQALASSHVIIWLQLEADLIFTTAEHLVDITQITSFFIEIVVRRFDIIITLRKKNENNFKQIDLSIFKDVMFTSILISLE